ncbi:MAG: pyridoxamine 5'-phosphate oxidase family protein [Acidimicrobiales bacterium]
MTNQASAEPRATRPLISGYGIPTSEKGLLPWSHVVRRLETASHHWVATASPGGRPHARPVDGIVVDGTLHFSGGDVRWMKNLRANPRVSMHLESADDVVIVDGRVEWVDAPDRVSRINAASKAKFGWETAPCWALRPEVVFAWTNFGTDSTRWVLTETRR